MHNIFERIAYYLIHVYNDINCASYQTVKKRKCPDILLFIRL